MQYVIVILFATILGIEKPQDMVSAANSFLNEKNYLEAKETIDEVFLKPETLKNARAWYTKGRIYHEILKTDAAELEILIGDKRVFIEKILEAYDQTKQLTGRGNNLFILADNQMSLLWSENVNKGSAYYGEGQLKKAIVWFDLAKVINSKDTTAYLFAGVSAQQLGEYELAIDNYKAMKELKTLSQDVYKYMFACYQAKGSNVEEQLDVMEEAIYDYPNHIPFILTENRLLMAMGRYEAAESRLQTVIRRNPDSYDLRIVRADLFDRIFRDAYNAGQPDKSHAYFDKASEEYEAFLTLMPDHFTANYNYAVMINERANRLYVKANLYSDAEFDISGEETQEAGHKWTRKALPFMEKALSLKPGDESTVVALKAFYQRLKLDEKLALLNNR